MGTWLLTEGLKGPKKECIEPLQLHNRRSAPLLVVQRIAAALVAGVAELQRPAAE